MPPDAARSIRSYDDILDQMTANHRTAIDATRAQLSEVPQQGQPVSLNDVGQLPVPSTPGSAAKDLVHKYGREAAAPAERSRVLEPEP